MPYIGSINKYCPQDKGHRKIIGISPVLSITP